MKHILTLTLAALLLSVGCKEQNVQLQTDRLIVGNWSLVELQQGNDIIAGIQNEVLYQFTADRQLVINLNGKRNSSRYIIKNDLLIVDDGNITNIKEKIKLEKLDKKELVLSFSMDGEESKMRFVRLSEVLQ